MKEIDQNNNDMSEFQIYSGEKFRFECHPGVSCFNLCCRNLNLFLYPYDVVRLKNKLGISSGEFIDKHVDVVLRQGNYFPEVLLKMSESEEKTCPFLTEEGCSVYRDRPDACRTFPVEHGVLFGEDENDSEDVHFFKPPEFCMGKNENKEWTIESWAQDQDAVTYNRMTRLWGGVKRYFHSDPWGGEGSEGPRSKMAFMATYNIDGFRDFIFQSSFLTRYKVKPDLLKKIKKDDAELMKFGFSWIKFYLWGIKTKKIKLR